MKGSLILFLVSFGFSAGCASSPRLFVTDPVGPLAPTPDLLSQEMGRLIVFSALDGLDTLDPEHPKHTAYRLHSDTDERRVLNQAGVFGDEPQAVDLRAGNYQVEGEAANAGLVRVPVVIKKGETTVVYLDGLTQPAAGADTQWVREADGLIVGRKDEAQAGPLAK